VPHEPEALFSLTPYIHVDKLGSQAVRFCGRLSMCDSAKISIHDRCRSRNHFRIKADPCLPKRFVLSQNMLVLGGELQYPALASDLLLRADT
jgi:hypothetical protein